MSPPQSSCVELKHKLNTSITSVNNVDNEFEKVERGTKKRKQPAFEQADFTGEDPFKNSPKTVEKLTENSKDLNSSRLAPKLLFPPLRTTRNGTELWA